LSGGGRWSQAVTVSCSSRTPALRRRHTGLAAALALTIIAACEGKPAPQAPLPARLDVIEGRVLESVDSPPYSYLRVEAGSLEIWAGVPIGGYAKDSTIRLTNCVALRNHLVRPLNRRLEAVYFGTVASR
jgi:hypothetical protein